MNQDIQVPKFAWKTFGDMNTASSRLRAFLPCQYLQGAGWSCEIFNPNHLDQYHLVIFQKTYDDIADIELARQLKQKGTKIIVDLCDNDFYNPKGYDKLSQRVENLKRMLEIVDGVSVSTRELGQLMPAEIPITVIDDALDLPQISTFRNTYLNFKKYCKGWVDRSLRVVWYGNNRMAPLDPPTGIVDVARILPVLEAVHQEYPIHLTIVSNSRALFEQYLGSTSFPTTYQPWKRSSFYEILKKQQVAIIPVEINPFTICKTHNRLVLSLILGVAVVADQIPSYREFKEFVLFSDWEKNLLTYANNPSLRQQHIRAGQQYILSTYTPARVIRQWSSLVEKTCDLQTHFTQGVLP